MMKVKLCSVEELCHEKGRKGRMVRIMDKMLAVFVVDSEAVVVDAECPHAGGPLHEGTIEGSCIVCPWHQYGFDLESGQCDADPNLSLRRYPTCIEQDSVWVDLNGSGCRIEPTAYVASPAV